ncbi:LysM peptidoglycan-binding domain-containing protein [Pseudomonas sp. UMC631]|nr:LysM peptidoglycan-binding domain-containing protein [Pseudomonas sp. UMA643]NTY18477.1 LysM peptidoglycan-binding domain-containing protein [Pseudomonas sp. UMC3103]NTY28746.1 LysM peptidoglycan-binding domain-containing protein [Pseudomonas sp. UMA603]NTY33446.1 LysM peptidoglycan-binding domain-containing protein [Pseudomonas sp. UMC3129]NTY57733.1 LysM peptidoglycan-binding domain-containing protein [Pseudomonas sp. UMC631]NTY66543.1 LysM peptidoglycan-binding domain-containing protein 
MPARASALELGDIASQAALGQTLDARIELRGMGDLGADDLKVSLVPQQEAERLGMEPNYVFLSGLRFTPEVGRNGRGVIRVQSSGPVREPYVNFVLQVAWPQGRAMREYTLLLDPPNYQAVAQAPSAPVVSAAPSAAIAAPVKAPGVAAPVPSGSHRIVAGDTLWAIASRHRPAGDASVMQTMRAIQALNPQAFIDGNANLPRVGAVLRLPDASQARAQGHAEAVSHFQAQEARWRERPRALDATRKAAPGAAPAVAEVRDQLRLQSGQASKQPQAKAAAERLALLQEDLDSARRQGEELTSRIGDLQSQLDKLNKLIELKDAQIATLVARLAAQSRQQAAPTEAEPPVAVAGSPTPQAAPAAAQEVAR